MIINKTIVVIIAVTVIMVMMMRCSSYSSSSSRLLCYNRQHHKAIVSRRLCSSSSSSSSSNDSKVFVVSTASRGIGLEFTKQILNSNTNTVVVALARSSSSSLSSLSSQYGNRLRIIPIDLEDPETIGTAGDSIKSVVSHVDVLINVAGILGSPNSVQEG